MTLMNARNEQEHAYAEWKTKDGKYMGANVSFNTGCCYE